jgi:hypothetical protein
MTLHKLIGINIGKFDIIWKIGLKYNLNLKIVLLGNFEHFLLTNPLKHCYPLKTGHY